MQTRRYWVWPAVGALAGACLILILMLLMSCLLLIGALWQYSFNSQIPVIQQSAWFAVVQDVSRLPGFLWGWRWIVFVLAVVGAGMAVLDRVALRWSAFWRGRINSATIFGLCSTLAISIILIGQDQVLSGEPTESIATLSHRLPSVWGQIGLALAPAIGIAGLLFMGWTWWYERWLNWLRLSPVKTAHVEAAQISADQWFEIRRSRAKIQQFLLIGLVGSIGLLYLVVTGYEQLRVTVASGDFWVDPKTTSNSLNFLFKRPIHRLVLENTYGNGSVNLQLLDAQGKVVVPMVSLQFRDLRVSYEEIELPVAALPPGVYQLQMQLAQGNGGRVSYALAEWNGLIAQVVAVLVGIVAGLLVGLLILLVGTWLQTLDSSRD